MSKKTVIANTVEWESIHISIPEDYMEYFDFIDLGAKNGKMIAVIPIGINNTP